MIPTDTKQRIRTSVDQIFKDEKIERKNSKAPSEYVLSSRRRSILRDDFTKLCILGTNGWIINKQLFGLLGQSGQLCIIGIMGETEECRTIIQSIVKQNICIYNHEDQGIFISRPFLINKQWKVPVAFLINTFKPGSADVAKFQFITGMLSHILIIFDWSSNLQRLTKYNETFKSVQKRLDKILGINQSVITFSYQNKNNYSMNSQLQDTLLQWGIIQIRSKSDLQSKQQILQQYIYHNLKKNYLAISSFLGVGYYYIFHSFWIQLNTHTFSQINNQKLINTYIQNVQKDIKEQYQSQINQNFQQNKDDIFVFQCLKSLRETNKSKFDKLTFFCKKQANLSQQRLIKYINKQEEEVVKKNDEENLKRNKEIADDCLLKIKKAMNCKCYTPKNMNVYADDFERFLDEYKIRSLGENSGEALRHWMYQYNKKVETYFTDVITNDLSKSVAKSNDQSKDDLIERIALTQGMLATVQKQIISLERKRDMLEKQSAQKKNKIDNIRKSLRQTKQRHKIDEQKKQRSKKHKTKSVDPRSYSNIAASTNQIKKKRKWLCFG